jgi:nicotinate-nucleotide adenylyltransferase
VSLILYGGTFDPLHLAHLRLALEALAELGAQQLCFLPCAVPPHRPQPGASATLRLDWVRQAIAGVPGFGVDDRELLRTGPSYTVDTLLELRQIHGPQRPLIWLIGEDALVGLPNWHQSQRLFDLAHFAVLRRHGSHERIKLQAQWSARSAPVAELLAHPAGRISWLSNSLLDISATELRAHLAAGRSVRYLVEERIRPQIEACEAYRAQPASK